jgi:NADP-dependent 3-hydroxy acid dehydrogenase YdfG
MFYFNLKLVFITVPSSSIGAALTQKFATQGVESASSAYRVYRSQEIAD